jgi:hypothetical protein
MALALGCEVETLDSRRGAFVTYYWSPSSNQLCGGTVDHIDRQIAAIAGSYSIALPQRASISYFWLPTNFSDGACGFAASGNCTIRHIGGSRGANTSIVSDRPYNSHEIAHAATLLGRGLPSFLAEGVAGRWQFGPSEPTLDEHVDFRGDLDYARVRSLLGMRQIPDADYGSAAHLWSWLEAEFGREHMGEWIAALSRTSTADEVESQFMRIFGRPLEEVVAQARGTPLLMWDDAACSMELPRHRWRDGEALAVGGVVGDCETNDFINFSSERSGRMYLVEFPDPGEFYSVDVEYVRGAEVLFYECLGRPRPFEFTRSLTSHPDSGTDPLPELYMAGVNVVVVLADVGDDGQVRLPQVRFTRP